MKLVFIRHGQGEHTLDMPSSLQIEDPSLTSKGIKQAKLLRNQITLTDKDIVIISPIRRTLETALIWSEDVHCRKIVSPFVAPRMFPLRPEGETLPCDKILDIEWIRNGFPTFEIDVHAPMNIWSDGINTLPEIQFRKLAKACITNWKQYQKEQIYIVSHDGTITSYRQMITGQNFTRNDFLNETGWFEMNC